MASERAHELIDEALGLLDQGHVFSALATAGEALTSVAEHSRERYEWQLRVAQRVAGLSPDALAQASVDAHERHERLARLVGLLDGSWDVDEVLLVLTLRQVLALAAWCARELKLPPLPDGAANDESLVEFAANKRGRGLVRSALAMIDKNSRSSVPFDLDLIGLRHLWDGGR